MFRPTADSSDGLLQWGTSYLLQALELRCRTTGDRRYADELVAVADQVLTLTDEALNRRDWRGRRQPVWSVASRYTALQGDLRDGKGAPVARLTLPPS